VVTSPPFWGLRSYGIGAGKDEIGREPTPEAYVANLVEVFCEVRRVLRGDGLAFVNLGDSYCGTGNKCKWNDPKYARGRNGQKTALNRKINGLKPKDLYMIPARVALALQADGWWLRSAITLCKNNPISRSGAGSPGFVADERRAQELARTTIAKIISQGYPLAL
jgi:DNA methylase